MQNYLMNLAMRPLKSATSFRENKKKPNTPKTSFFGSSAILSLKTLGFPSPPHEGFGFIVESFIVHAVIAKYLYLL